MNTNNYSKFKSLKKFNEDNDKNKMEIDNINNDNNLNINDSDYKEYDKNNYIKKLVDNCNLITKEKK